MNGCAGAGTAEQRDHLAIRKSYSHRLLPCGASPTRRRLVIASLLTETENSGTVRIGRIRPDIRFRLPRRIGRMACGGGDSDRRSRDGGEYGSFPRRHAVRIDRGSPGGHDPLQNRLAADDHRRIGQKPEQRRSATAAARPEHVRLLTQPQVAAKPATRASPEQISPASE